MICPLCKRPMWHRQTWVWVCEPCSYEVTNTGDSNQNGQRP